MNLEPTLRAAGCVRNLSARGERVEAKVTRDGKTLWARHGYDCLNLQHQITLVTEGPKP